MIDLQLQFQLRCTSDTDMITICSVLLFAPLTCRPWPPINHSDIYHLWI